MKKKRTARARRLADCRKLNRASGVGDIAGIEVLAVSLASPGGNDTSGVEAKDLVRVWEGVSLADP